MRDASDDVLEVELAANAPDLYAKQEDWFYWEPPDSELHTEFVGGSWRSGKTLVAILKFIWLCMLNGWRPEYGERGYPVSVLIAPTARVLRDATLKTLLAIAPAELILRHKKSEGEIHWVNGHVTLLRSAEGEIDGFEATHVLADEVHKPIYWLDPSKMTNFKARCSDALAVRRAFIACGLPTAGRVREKFEFCDNVMLLAAADNPNNSAAFVESLRADCPAGWEATFLFGQWMTPPGAVFHMWSADRHLLDQKPLDDRAIHIGMDLGNHARVVFGEERPDGSLHIVDEMITYLVGAKDTCAAIKETKWAPRIRAESIIAPDPKVARDDLRTIRNAFPGSRVVQQKQSVNNVSNPFYNIDPGIQLMQAAMLNAKQEVRLTFARHLKKNRNGVVDAIESCKRHEILGHIVKDDRTDHSRDAVRYLAIPLLRDRFPIVSLGG